jgi:hypothetical protein
MAIQESQLGQQRPGTGGTAVSLYSPAASTTGIVKSVVVCNTSGSATTYRIYLDDNGTTYDQTTALFYDVPIRADDTHILSIYWPMDDSSGNLAVESADASALTFTAFGAEIT